jgi:hypothetical protein
MGSRPWRTTASSQPLTALTTSRGEEATATVESARGSSCSDLPSRVATRARKFSAPSSNHTRMSNAKLRSLGKGTFQTDGAERDAALERWVLDVKHSRPAIVTCDVEQARPPNSMNPH